MQELHTRRAYEVAKGLAIRRGADRSSPDRSVGAHFGQRESRNMLSGVEGFHSCINKTERPQIMACWRYDEQGMAAEGG